MDQACADTWCGREDLLGVIADWDRWREKESGDLLLSERIDDDDDDDAFISSLYVNDCI